MLIHAIRHVPYEGLGYIDDWISDTRLQKRETLLTESQELPTPDDFDALVIMGGPMSIHDENLYPWLGMEKKLIKDTIDRGKKVLGICLGSQLVAHCIGGRVYPNLYREIGWFPITKKFFFHSWFPLFDERDEMTVLHWHGDTFELPAGAVQLFSSEACENQAFTFEDHVVGLQFHLEMKEENIRNLIGNTHDGLQKQKYVHDADLLVRGSAEHGENARQVLYTLLDYFMGG